MFPSFHVVLKVSNDYECDFFMTSKKKSQGKHFLNLKVHKNVSREIWKSTFPSGTPDNQEAMQIAKCHYRTRKVDGNP